MIDASHDPKPLPDGRQWCPKCLKCECHDPSLETPCITVHAIVSPEDSEALRLWFIENPIDVYGCSPEEIALLLESEPMQAILRNRRLVNL